MHNDLRIIGRSAGLFDVDIGVHESHLREIVSSSRFLIIGAAGSIGQAVTKEVFKRNPRKLHVVDISENNLVELVRDLRSSVGYVKGEFLTFAVDCGEVEFRALVQSHGPYDYVLNLSALKHVRSESDPFTLMRLIRTNVFNTVSTSRVCAGEHLKKYFCVSTDKAANPVNMMGASKRIMELFMMRESSNISTSMARFANVAFSDGSLLHGFEQRLRKQQPLSAPNDVKRYFVTFQESGELCLMSALLGQSKEVFFPKLSADLHLTQFSEIAVRFLEQRGYEAVRCATEQEARDRVDELKRGGKWPCYFFESDTTGEKDFEEFFTGAEEIEWNRYEAIGVISNSLGYNGKALDTFEEGCYALLQKEQWSKDDLLNLYRLVLPDFGHLETGKYLDQRM